MANNLQTQLTIRADVQGTNEVNQLANSLGQVGDELNQATQPASATAQALGNVANSANNTHHSATTLSQSIAQVNAGLAGTSANLTHMGNSSHNADASLSKLKNTLLGMAGAYVGIDAVKNGIGELIETSKSMDSLNQKLSYATGGAKQAGEAFEYLKNMAKELGLSQMDLANGYAQLASATKGLGLNQDETRIAFEGVAKATAAMSLTADEANGVFLALSQIASKGKVSMEELRGQLGERLTPAFSIAAQAMGVTTAELEKMVESGIDAKEFLPKFGAAMSEAFGAQASNNIKTTTGAINLLTNKMTDLNLKILEGLGGDVLASGTQLLADSIDGISQALDNIDPTSIEAVKQVFAQLFNVVGTIGNTLSGLYTDFNNLFAAMTGFDATTEKVGFLTRALQGIGVVIGAIDDVFKGLQATANLTVGAITSTLSQLYAAMAKIDILPDSMQAKYQNMSDGLKKASDDAFARLKHNVNSFESSTKQALDATIVSANNTAEQAKQAAIQAKVSFDGLAKSGKASTTELENAFKDYAHKAIEANNGVVDEVLKQELAQRNLQAVVDETGKVIISSMDNAKKAVDGVDLSKHAESFKALGIDMSEFAGGLSSKANTALGAFNDLAKVADGNLQQLAMAYGGVRGAIGDNAQGLAELDRALTQAVGGSTALAQGVKALATEQQNAKNATNAQSKALAELGVNMNAINQGMSDGGQKIAQSLSVGLSAIKQTATSADALKTALAKALDTSLQKAQTVADFNAIKKAIEEAGLASQVSSAQMQALQAASAKAQGATKEQTTATQAHTTATKEQTAATAHATHTKKQNAAAAHEAAAATDRLATSQKNATRQSIDFGANLKEHVRALKEYGASAEALEQVNNNLFKSLEGRTYGSFEPLLKDMDTLARHTQRQLEDFRQLSGELDGYSKKLGSSSLSVHELERAQAVLNSATHASINGIAVMDNAKLEQLQAQIEAARAKMQGLADDARRTADSLEGELARMQGNDRRAIEIENTKKLADLEAKLAQARQRNNTQEIKELERALALQEQINNEKLKKHQEQEQQKQERQKSNTQGQSNQKPTSDNSITSQTTLSASEVAGAFGDAIDQARRGAVNDFARQLMSEAKRMAN